MQRPSSASTAAAASPKDLARGQAGTSACPILRTTCFSAGAGDAEATAWERPARRSRAGRISFPARRLIAVRSPLRPNRYQPGFVAWQRRTVRPLRDVGGSITRRGLARDVAVIPGLCCKCAYAGSRVAKTAVNVTRGGCGAGMSVRRKVPRSYMALASHGGSCEHGCSDQSSRQKFKLGHSISPQDMRSQTFGLNGNERGHRPFKENSLSRCFNVPRGQRIVRSRIPALT